MNAETRAHRLLNKINRLDPAGKEKRKADFQKVCTSGKGKTKDDAVRKFKIDLRTAIKQAKEAA